MILQASHLQKSFSGETVIVDGTFHLEENDKAALVGNNGAGKTTMFRMLTGELSPDEGTVFLKKGAVIGYLKQESDLVSDRTIYDEVLSVRENVFVIEREMHELEAVIASGAGSEDVLSRYSRLQEQFEQENGYAADSEVTGTLKGLGFSEEQFRTSVHTLSGGEKTRVALSKLLISSPDVLLLDEPTNHLDIQAISWLETFLSSYPKTVLIVSHDRYFLDKVVKKVIDLERGKTRTYEGNYTVFMNKKRAEKESLLRAYEKQQDRIRHEESVIETLKSYNREKSIKRAESREKLLGKIDRIEKPTEERNDIRLSFQEKTVSGKEVLTVENVSKSFGNRTLLSDVSLSLRRQEHVTLIGANGTGKTTFLKILTGLVKPDSGVIRYGTNVVTEYYDQAHESLSKGKTPFDEIHDEYPRMTETEVRNLLASFLFIGDDVFKPTEKLSGGEKSRLLLAKLMHSGGNFLILDEPTNHLDMAGKEALEDALNQYPGTVLAVSHDRYFVNTVSTRIIELYRNSFLNYPGNYDYYLEKRDLFHETFDKEHPQTAVQSSAPSAEKEKRLKKKEEETARRRKENEIKSLEQRMEALQKKIDEIEKELLLPENATDAAVLQSLQEEKDQKETLLAALFADWEALL